MRSVGRDLGTFGLIATLHLQLAHADERIQPAPGAIHTESVSAKVLTPDGPAIVTPLLFTREVAEQSVLALDLLIDVDGGPLVVVDPLFRAPGLEFSVFAVFAETADDVRLLRIPRHASAGTFHVGCVEVPNRGIVGTSLRMRVESRAGQAVKYYGQLLLAKGSMGNCEEIAECNLRELVARSKAQYLGSFPKFSRFVLSHWMPEQLDLREVEGVVGRKETGQIITAFRLLEDGDAIVSFWNVAGRDITTCDPWLRYKGITDLPVHLRPVGQGAVDLFAWKHGSSVLPTATMNVTIPAGVIIGSRIKLPAELRDRAQANFRLTVEPDFIVERHRGER